MNTLTKIFRISLETFQSFTFTRPLSSRSSCPHEGYTRIRGGCFNLQTPNATYDQSFSENCVFALSHVDASVSKSLRLCYQKFAFTMRICVDLGLLSKY